MPRDRGQASIEYVAVVALVGLVLTVAVAVTSGGLGERIAAALRAGMCRVTGAACPPPPAPAVADVPPCPLAEENHERSATFDLSIIHLGHRVAMRVVSFSDDHAEVSLDDGRSIGVHVGLGAHVESGPVSLGAELEGGIDWEFGAGKTWRFPDRPAADRFINAAVQKVKLFGRLDGHNLDGLPEADSVSHEHGQGLTLEAKLGAGVGGSATADLMHRVLGSTTNRDGSTAVYMRTDIGLHGDLISGLGATADLMRTGVVEVDYDPAGEATAVVLRGLTRRGMGQGREGAPGTVRETETALAAPTTTDLLAALALVHHGRATGAPAADFTALFADLRRRATVTTRAYLLRSRHFGVGVVGRAGIFTIGGDVAADDSTARLVSETVRPPGLPAMPRDGCPAGA